MKKIVNVIILLIMFFPMIVFADKYDESVNKAKDFLLRNDYKNSYIKYLISNTDGTEFYDKSGFVHGGLLSKKEFQITTNSKGNKFSYLYDGQKYWTLTTNSHDDVYVINSNDTYLEKDNEAFTRVTEYVLPETRVNGTGTTTDPWVFNAIYTIHINVNDPSLGKISESTGCVSSAESLEFVNIITNKTIYLCPTVGNRYVGSTCGAVINDYYALSNSISIRNSGRDISCTINFDTATYKIKLDQTDTINQSKPATLYVIYNKGWYLNKSGSTTIQNLTELPTRKGYKFVGYYTNEIGGEQVIDETGNILVGNTTLFESDSIIYPHWIDNNAILHFHANGGTISGGRYTLTNSLVYYNGDIYSQSVARSGQLPTTGLIDPDNASYLNLIKDGYHAFDGKEWCSTTNGSGTCFSDSEPNYSGEDFCNTDDGDCEKTLYVNWDNNNYTVVYNGNGHTGGSTSSSAHTYDVAKTLTPNGFTKSGYNFAGWATSATGGVVYGNSASVTNLTTDNGGTVTLYAKWTPITYTIAYNGNGHTGGSTASSTHTYTVAKNLTANGFTKTGHSFAGWATSATGGVVYGNSASVSNLATTQDAVVTLYAKWTPNPYTITKNAYKWKAASSSWEYFNQKTYTQNYGTNHTITASDVTTPTGYYYGNNPNWSINGYTTSSGTNPFTVTNNTEVHIHYYPNTYTIVYNGNGNTGGSTASSTHTYDVAKNLTANGFTRSGYNFAGWATSATGGVVYGNSASVTNLTSTNGGTVTLFAKWTPNSVTITINGGYQEKITYTGPASNTVTLNDRGTATITVPGGTYSFVGGWSGFNRTINTDSTRTANVYPDGAIFWYGNGDEAGESLLAVTGGWADSNNKPSTDDGSNRGYEAGPWGMDHKLYTTSQYQSGYHVTSVTNNTIDMSGYSTIKIEYNTTHTCSNSSSYSWLYKLTAYKTNSKANNYGNSGSLLLAQNSDTSGFAFATMNFNSGNYLAINLHPYFCVKSGGSSMISTTALFRRVWRE